MKPTDTTARDAERKARAIAFLQEKPKAGKPWTSKDYDYREESSDGNQNMARHGVFGRRGR